ncbi:MAG: helix-turn-helix transcriptional regulator [Lachnospiraceae bacterium]|nr:helix-turn-helix transcriptional regulator [Lachnospiraceae bacterium]MCM1238252.1 helix-turn-helix transcriptional regulator [Lachnospiraceae bacterium]
MRRLWMKLKAKEALKLLGILAAFFLFCMFNVVATAGASGLREYADFPSIGPILLFTAVVLWLGGMGKDFLNGLQLAFSRQEKCSRIKLQRACNVMKYTRTLIFLEAAAQVCVGLVDFMYHADAWPIITYGPCVAIILLSIMYASIIAVLLTIFIAKLENMLASYMEEPEADLTVEEAQTIYFKLRAMGLTDREAEVARLVSCNLTNREIGQMLYISDTTVKKHITHILEKTALTDREELTKMIKGL